MISPKDALVVTALAAVVAGLGTGVGWLLLNRRARRWSMRAALAVLVGTPVLVVTVCVSAAAALMIVSGHVLAVLLTSTAAACDRSSNRVGARGPGPTPGRRPPTVDGGP